MENTSTIKKVRATSLKVLFILVSSLTMSSCRCQQVVKYKQIDNGFPQIAFEKTCYDFGVIGTGTTKHCKFTFANKGCAPLIIEDVKGACKCTVADLTKKVYEPNEIGTIEVTYTTEAYSLPITRPKSKEQQIVVYSNDPESKKITLTVRADIIDLIQVAPTQLEFEIGRETLQPIVLRSIDETPFSILEYKSSKNIFDFEYDPSNSATKHVLYPLLNKNNLQKTSVRRGRIYLTLSHPDCGLFVFPFTIK